MIVRQGDKTLSSECKKRVIVQTKTSTLDGIGGVTDTWSDARTVWAAISPIKATQVYQYRSVNVDASHIIKIRGAITIAESDRIKYGSRYFEVLCVEDIQERGIMKIVTCLERR